MIDSLDKLTGITKVPKGRPGKIVELAQAKPELTTREIGKIVGCNHSNVIQTLQRYGIEKAIVDGFNENKVRILNGLQEKILKELSSRSLEKESAHTLIVDAGIIQDKIRDIIHGKSGNSGVNININIGDPTKVIDVIDT